MTAPETLPEMSLTSGYYSAIASIGCDPEFLYETEDGTLVPAFDALQERTEKTPPTTPYIDGWQGEFGTPPTHCIAYLVDGVHAALCAVHDAGKKAGARISTRSVLSVDVSRLFDDPARAQFGCTPSLNAYDDIPAMAQDGLTVPFRMAGGHIHLGLAGRYGKLLLDEEAMRKVVKFLDRTAGLIGCGLFSDVEDARRRLLYGRAGEYRRPSYGIEYRVPSNAWLLHPALAHFYVGIVRRAANAAVVDLANGHDPLDRVPLHDEEVQIAINDQRPDIARRLMQENAPVYEMLIAAAAGTPVATRVMMSAVLSSGVSSLLPDNYTLEDAWYIDRRKEWRLHSYSKNCSMSMSEEALSTTGRLAV